MYTSGTLRRCGLASSIGRLLDEDEDEEEGEP